MPRLALLALPLTLWAAPAPAQPAALIFFGPHSAALDEPATALLQAFAAEAGPDGAPVEVRGFADPEGSLPFNRAISLARAEHVAHVLRELGLPAARIRVTARGPVTPVLDDQESRRVEVRIAR